jgi:hypothetical protein
MCFEIKRVQLVHRGVQRELCSGEVGNRSKGLSARNSGSSCGFHEVSHKQYRISHCENPERILAGRWI